MKQFAVIGLGNFGHYLGIRLYEKGHEVLAIDKDARQIQEIKDRVSRAVVADATDRKAMEAVGIKEVDTAVLCTGTVLSDSILIALNLKDIGVKRLLAKAMSDAHGRILSKIGVSEVFFPEKDLAITMAERLHNPNMLDYLPFMEGYGIVELVPPREFIGKRLRDLDLINRFGIQVVAVKEMVPERVNMIPTANFVLKDSDVMILLGPDENLEKLRKMES